MDGANVGAVVIDSEGAAGTQGLRMTVPATADNSESVCLQVSLDGMRSRLVIEADVRLDLSGVSNLDLLNVRTAARSELGVHVNGMALAIEEDRVADGGEVELLAKSTATLGSSYRRVRFAIDVGATTAKAELFVDGVSVATHQSAAAPTSGKTVAHIGDCHTRERARVDRARRQRRDRRDRSLIDGTRVICS